MEKILVKCAVVDDSSAQRLAVVQLIKKHPQLEFVSAWNNAIEAKNGLIDTETDLLFLDIEMPVLNGFSLLDDLENKPHVIIVTGKTKYAQKAFDYRAVDFLKKPLKPSRFNITVDKILEVQASTVQMEAQNDAAYTFIKSGIKKYKVFLQDILYISAMGDFAKIHLETNNSLVVNGTMAYLQSTLPHEQFFRSHRSFIVNLKKIERFTSRSVEIKNEIIPISRQKNQELKRILSTP